MKTKVKIAFGIMVCVISAIIAWFIYMLIELPWKSTFVAIIILTTVFAVIWSAKVLGEYSGNKPLK